MFMPSITIWLSSSPVLNVKLQQFLHNSELEKAIKLEWHFYIQAQMIIC